MIISGSVGVGKSGVADAMSEILINKHMPHAVVDMDCLRDAFPRPKEDPFHEKLGLKNLSAVWKNFKEAGVTCLIIPNVVEHRSYLDKFQSAIPGAEITIVRLRAKNRNIQKRLKDREEGSSLKWHLKRAEELTKKLEDARVEDFVVDTDDKKRVEIAKEILSKTNWLDLIRDI